MLYIYIFIFLVLLFIFLLFNSFLFNFLKNIVSGKRLKKKDSCYKKESFFRKIFISFPKIFVDDLFSKNPNEFDYYGVHLFVGEQGSGKTISALEFVNRLQQMYPRVKVGTNLFYFYEDYAINSWQDLIEHENGVFGCVNFIDELQNWFSCNDSKDFPPLMLQEVTQQRKQRKVLIGTSQIFGRVSKPLREQVNYVYVCKTFLGCITVVRVSKPIYYNEQKFQFSRFLKTYFFVHKPSLRDSYDTYRKITRLKKVGFNNSNLI